MKDLLLNVLSQPTSPFRETWVSHEIKSQCAKRMIPFYEDPIGNLWLGCRSQSDLKKIKVLFMAHMDHPGFVIEGHHFLKPSRNGDYNLAVTARWLGGGPLKNLKNHAVRLFSHKKNGYLLDGKISSYTLNGQRSVDRAQLHFRIPLEYKSLFQKNEFIKQGPWGACLWYPKGPARIQGKNLITKAADDLGGCCALIEALTMARCPQGVAVCLTRAEESGFHGALAVLSKKYISPRTTYMISVETSAQLPGAMSGHGPVIRLGDRSSVFNGALMRWLEAKATQVKDCVYQKRIMDGGSCEATAFNSFGFVVGGLSIPLVGYHNIGSNKKAVPEQISLNDAINASRILSNAMAHAKELPEPSKIQEFSFSKMKESLLKNLADHKHYF